MDTATGYQRLAMDEEQPNQRVELPTPQRSSLRLELQGLRAVAIIAVLLFHSWGSVFQTGFLGVDVFFVLSGYLMCHLLAGRMPLGLDDVLDFYFRRIKRIVPIYLCVIMMTLFAAKYVISRLDFQQLIDEAVPSMLFYSNFPSVHKTEYFDLKSKYTFLLHTWSLSTEMQFYLIVPLFFLIAQRVQKWYYLWPLVILLFVVSFVRQSLADGVAKHMTLDGRIWQFLAGFAAYFAFEFFQLSKNGRLVTLLSKPIVNFCVVAVMVCLLLVKLSTLTQLTRCCVILCTAVFVLLPNGEESMLSVDGLITLGDVSYSVYLVHWPIFTLHKFIDEKQYDGKVGTYLITVSIIFGYLVEKCWKRFVVTNWTSLLLIILALYAGIGMLLADLSKNAIAMDKTVGDVDSTRVPNVTSFPVLQENKSATERGLWIREDGSVDVVAEHTEEFWSQRHNPKPIPSKEAFNRNAEVVHYGDGNVACAKPSRKLPLPYSKGNGTKNIVVVGNSHAYSTYYGIRRHFIDLIATISLISRAVCTPVPQRFQQSNFGPSYPIECAKYINETVDLLQRWPYPIDIIVAMYGFHSVPDQPPVTNWTTDPEFVFMEDYYQQLSAVAREVVFVPSISVRFSNFPMKILSDKLLKNAEIGIMGETLEKQLNYLPNIRDRIEHIHCPNCVVMNWHRLWCRAENGTFCQTVEPVSNIALFVDDHHPSPYGSMFVGEYIRQSYDEFTKKRKD